ncbi:flavodoxin reductase [Pedobacter sp. BS3]|uniref:flavodoxin reductase n=1 Tax=Pedobacter sp. BS3 TaxID=2567937 RepID=UPI0011EED4F0|nr:flavodoxin reductase [Pedobacter sp. BS3]TZF84469.1 flavodoxin reductase [Pedobacter sp. BS3]
MSHIVKIKSIDHVTHDVLQVVTEKPAGYVYTPGQATDVSVNKPGWENELRAFTFTSLPDKDYIEFTIKTYPERDGVTNQLLQLKHGDELILHDVFGDIAYKGEGVFIAGGAGVTPFIAIFRYLQANNQVGNNKLIFANKTRADIIHEADFKRLLGKNFINILSHEQAEDCAYGYISEAFLKENMPENAPYVYLCGPPPMMDAVESHLKNLDIPDERVVKEGF